MITANEKNKRRRENRIEAKKAKIELLRNNNPMHDKSYKELTQELKSGNSQIKNYLSQLVSVSKGNATSSKGMRRNRALFNKALQQFDMEKFAMKYRPESTEEVRDLLERAVTWEQSAGLTRKEALELISLDDLPDLITNTVKAVSPFIPYGGVISSALPFANSIYDGIKRYIIPNRGNEIDQRISGKIDEKVSFNTETFDPTRVDVPSLGYVFCPEKCKGVARFDDVLPGAVYTGFYEIPVVPSTATGAAFVFVNCSAGSTGSQAFSGITYTNGASNFNITTGSYTSVVNVNNPTFTPFTQGNITAARIVGCSVTYKSVVKNTTNISSGQVDVYHNPSYVGEAPGYDGGLTLQNIGYQPFYQRGPITEDYSQTFYNALDSIPYMSSAEAVSKIKAPIAYLFSGCNTAGTQIGTITVHYTFNVISSATGLSSMPMLTPGVGPYTADIMDTIFTLAPEVFMSTPAEREALFKKLNAVKPNYLNLMDVIMGHSYSRSRWHGQIVSGQSIDSMILDG